MPFNFDEPYEVIQDDTDFDFTAPYEVVGEEASFTDRLKDTGIDAAKGIISSGQGLVGIADLVTGNLAGKGLAKIGYDPAKTQEILSSGYSDERQRENIEVQNAEGFGGKIKSLLENPSVAAGTVVQSAPMTIGSLGVVKALATRMLSNAGIQVGTQAAAEFLRKPEVISKLVAAGGAAEGAQTAGSIQEQAREQDAPWSESVIPAVAAGAGTAGISVLSSKIPGLQDAEVSLARALAGGADRQTLLDMGKSFVKTLIKEGPLEELPQGMQEQVFTNIALGRPELENVAEAGAEGLVAGVLQGGGMSAFSSGIGAVRERGIINSGAEKILGTKTVDEAIDAFSESLSKTGIINTYQPNTEPAKIYRDQPQESVSSVPFYADSEALEQERLARARNTIANTPQYEPELPRGPEESRLMSAIIGSQEDVQRQADERAASMQRQDKEWAAQQAAAQEYNQQRNAPDLGWAYKPPKEIDDIATNAKIDRLMQMPEIAEAKEKESQENVYKEIENDLKTRYSGKRWSDDDGQWTGAKSSDDWFAAKNVLSYFEKKYGEGETAKRVAGSVNKKNVATIIMKLRTGGKLTGAQQEAWDYIKDTRANELLDKNKEIDSGITKAEDAGIDIGPKRTVVVGDLNEGDKVVIENKGIPDVVEHKGYDEEGNVILEDGKRFTVDQFDKLDIYGEKKAEGLTKGQQIKAGDTDLTYQGKDAMGLHHFIIKSDGPANKANISTTTLDPDAIRKATDDTVKRFSDGSRIAKTLGKEDMINGITRAQAGDMLADGDEAVLGHIREGMEKHGKLAMEDAIRNQEITEVAGVPKAQRGEIKEKIAKLKPQIDEILNGKAAPDAKTPTSAGEGTGAADKKLLMQIIDDQIATYKSKRENPPAHLLKKKLQLSGVNISSGEIVSNEVFGHPSATTIGGGKYSNLIPIKIKTGSDIDTYFDSVQKIVDELQPRIKSRKGVKPLDIEEATILDLLRNETIPELNRLARELDQAVTDKKQETTEPNPFAKDNLKKGHYIKRKQLGLGGRASSWEQVTGVGKDGFLVAGLRGEIPFGDVTDIRTGMPELNKGEVIFKDGKAQAVTDVPVEGGAADEAMTKQSDVPNVQTSQGASPKEAFPVSIEQQQNKKTPLKKVNLKTESGKTILGYANQEEAFLISNPSGAKISGYVVGSDFPGERSSPTRGEIFYIDVPDSSRRNGVGTTLSIDALRLMKENGAETVNLSTTSEGGRALVDSLVRKGFISKPIRKSSTGKAEYKILLGISKQAEQPRAEAETAPSEKARPGEVKRQRFGSAQTDTLSEAETELRELSHDKEEKGDILLGNGKYVKLSDAVKLAKEGVDSGEIRLSPAQLNFKLDVSMDGADKIIEAIKSEVKETPQAKEPKESDVKYSRAPKSTNTVESVTAAISGSKRVRKLLDDGRIKVVEKSADIPTSATSKAIIDPETGKEILNAAGYVKSTDTIYLSAEAIPSGQEENFLAHESWHRAEETGNLDPLLGELERLEKMAGNRGKVAEWFTKAMASARYDKGTKAHTSEIAAYAVQNYEQSPNIIKRWVDKLIAKVRASIFQIFGIMPRKLDPAFLREIALSGLRGTVEKGGAGTVFSRAEIIKQAKAFYSKLAEVSNLKFMGMKAQGVENFLLKQGVKKVEIEATGLREWLAGKKPTDKVTKEELLDFVRANTVELEDVILRGTVSDVGPDLPSSKITHFSDYQEPGAEEGSYREMFVTAPLSGGDPMAPYNEYLGGLHAKYKTTAVRSVASEAENAKLSTLWKKYEENQGWKDGHPQYSDIKNPIVRIRFNTRTDTQGRKILFIEEMQGPSKSNQEKMPGYLKDNIYQLGAKRILAYAKENGFDGVSWTSGDMQADRYDLSKQVDEIDWSRENKLDGSPGEYTISAAKDGAFIDGTERKGINIEQVENLFGKNIADQILDAEGKYIDSGVIKGDGLRVGGEGLKQLYDFDVPKMFEAYGRGKIEEAKIDFGPMANKNKLDELRLAWSEGRISQLEYEQEKQRAKLKENIVDIKFIPITDKTPDSYTVFSRVAPIIEETFDVPEKHTVAATIKAAFDPLKFKKENVKKTISKARTQLIDKLHPIEVLGDVPYKLHSLLNNTHAVIGTFLQHGKLAWKDNALIIENQKDEGFLPWLHSLGEDGRNLFYWIAVKRAEALENDPSGSRENWLTNDKRDKILNDQVFKGLPAKDRFAKEKEFAKLNDKFQEYNQNVIDIAVEAGLISKAQTNDWMRDFYLPFYRILEDEATHDEFLQGPAKSRKFISAQIKRLKGGEEKLGDPLENILRNWTHLIQESQRNVARSAAADVMVKEGYAEVVPGNETFKSPGARRENFIISYQKDGKSVFLKVNDVDLFEALSNANAKVFDSALLKVLTGAKRLLTAGATFTPAFRIANMFRDTVHTSIVSKSFFPFLDTAKGFAKVWAENKDYIALSASGGGFSNGYIESGDPKAMARSIEKILEREGKGTRGNILDTPRRILQFWERVGTASEMAARTQLYSNLRMKGETHMEAAFQARDLMDFYKSGAGNSVRIIMATTPFLNARIQGLDRLYRGWQADKKSFFAKGALLAGASLMLWAAFKDDDRYKELEDWEKWQYHHFWIGETHFRMPKAFEVGAIFSSLFESAANVVDGQEDFDFFVDFLIHTLTQTFALSFPAAIGPSVEVYANKSAFTKRPIESMGQERLPAGERSDPWTPEFLKDLGAATNISPKKMEHIIRGHTAAFGMMFITVTDAFYRVATGAPPRPAKRINDIPGLGRFVQEPSSRTKYGTRYYEFAKEVDELAMTISNYKNIGDYEKARKLAIENKDSLRYKSFVNKTKTLLSVIRKQEKLVWSSMMTPEKKRERLRELNKKKNSILQNAYNRVYK